MSLAWLLRRLLTVLYTLLVVSILVFGMTQILPADAAVTLLGENATPEALAAVRAAARARRSGVAAILALAVRPCCTAISAPRCAPTSRSGRRCSSRWPLAAAGRPAIWSCWRSPCRSACWRRCAGQGGRRRRRALSPISACRCRNSSPRPCC